jgi:hypothetical protein
MSDSRIRAVLEDGPRTGEVLMVDAGAKGQPPQQVVVSDPLGSEQRREEVNGLDEVDEPDGQRP